MRCGKSHGEPQPWPSLALGHGRLDAVAFPCKNTSVPPALTCTSTRRRMERPLPWLFPCRLLGQQVKTHLISEAHVLAQLLWKCFGVMLPPGKAQGCRTAEWGQQRWGRAGTSTQVPQPRQQAPCSKSSLCIQSRAGSNLAVWTPGTLRTRCKGNSIFLKLWHSIWRISAAPRVRMA